MLLMITGTAPDPDERVLLSSIGTGAGELKGSMSDGFLAVSLRKG
ncbi:hypothetical protein [Blastococcus brunescens]|uniref:Uncharacterized protein n=1 Tax=Blastococcus brunescens TaxID=1564165 RepID=A0ABZ1B5K1_9ACTN|nr:hypothetical protein [Blastococcus sp. BMG 8361]WRL65123.1 hypothetical protein U6N30_05405 [Blastococcus sp. BMG 8361]